MQLPREFQTRLREWLGDTEAEALFAALTQPATAGLRVNRLKTTPEMLKALTDWNFAPIPWSVDGFTLSGIASVGKHPYHAAGLYYLQEPSAQAVAVVLNAQAGERILDLCAAPGGKSTQIAAALQGTGVLVANEFDRSRVAALISNLERCGVTNAIVTNASAEKLVQSAEAIFDRVLVDAPCSGEGMFRKGDEALQHWSPANILGCAARQRGLLENAADLVREGGILVYSTCTFAPEEDEGVVATFLEARPDFDLEAVPQIGADSGHPDWANGDARLARCLRFWPHKIHGEGHFIARFRKKGDTIPVPKSEIREPEPLSEVTEQLWQSFYNQTFQIAESNALKATAGNRLYRIINPPFPLAGIAVLQNGLWLGTLEKNRFEPSHSLALASKMTDVQRSVNFAPDDAQLSAYLRGETLESDGEDGWCLVGVSGFSLGWGKRVQGIVKNHFPKGLRRFA